MYYILDVNGILLIPETFATQDSAIEFAVRFLPDNLDFVVEKLENERSQALCTIKDAEVVNLVLWKERKYGKKEVSNQ